MAPAWTQVSRHLRYADVSLGSGMNRACKRSHGAYASELKTDRKKLCEDGVTS